MPTHFLLRIAAAASFLSGNAVAAPPQLPVPPEPPAQAPTNVPTNAATQAPAPAPAYESAFAGYRSAQAIANPPSLDDWREANNTVARIGGHAGVMREMTAPPDGKQAPAAAMPSTTPQAAPKAEDNPATDPHHGHGGGR